MLSAVKKSKSCQDGTSIQVANAATIPSVTWDQVGALKVARKLLQTTVDSIQSRFYQEMASFILVKGPELLNKYVGESERAVRDLFQRARFSKPCIVFFDEMDSVVPPRANATTESGARVVNALLTELDGGSDRSGVYVIGTTSHPELIDEAFLRPGRIIRES
ncbi:hypothetical protein E4U27_003184 [Claviceps purpurea]|nr:hypothetical protein E4U27_003184 [Claviceps purpurea]